MLFKRKKSLTEVVITGLSLFLLQPHVHAQTVDSSLAHNTLTETTEEKPDNTLETMIVLGTRKANYTEITEDTQKLVEMPGSLGDPLGAISALPGVITPAGGGEPAVRGSSPSDNRYYIDDMPAGYIFHQFNTSIFDENVVQDFQLFSAGFGAQYSGATGAIFDIRLRDPKNQNITTTLNTSLLRAGIFVEGGVTDNSAFMLSARKGLIQFFLPEEDEAGDNGIRIISAPQDSDYQFKYAWNINDNNKLTFSLAGAQDFAEAELTELADFVQLNPDFSGDAVIDERFDSQGISWEHMLENGGDVKLSIAHYVDESRVEWGEDYFNNATLDNNIIKGRYTLPLSTQHTLTLGGEHSHYDYTYATYSVIFVCTDFDVDCESGRRETVNDNRTLSLKDSTLYVIDNWQATHTLNIETGVQWNTNTYTNETFVNPRIALYWQAWDAVAITSSAGRYNRLPNVETMLPVLGNPNIHSPQAQHFTLGFKGELLDNWNWSAEAYHKNLTQLPLALDASQEDAEQLYSNDIEGTAQGFDILVNRNLANNWYGWASLSYSTSERTNKRTTQTQDYTLDTPIVFNLVGSYQLTPKWNTGFRFTAKSGEAITEIVGIKENPNFPDRYSPVYGQAYADRLPLFARLDIRAERDITLFNLDGSFYIDILNALNRENINGVGLDYEKVNETGELHLEEQANMGIFGSIGLSIVF